MYKAPKLRPQKFDDINFKNHFLEGFVWPIKSSRSDDPYSVVFTSKGLTCNCQAGTYRGKCKHAQLVHDTLVKEDPLPRDLF